MRAKPGKGEKWFQNACVGIAQRSHHTEIIKIQGKAEGETEGVSEPAEVHHVSRSKARQIRAERHRALRDCRKAEKTMQHEAVQAAVEQMCDEADGLEVVHESILPFSIHASHKDVVELGGYAGCLRCGRFASCAQKNNGMEQTCRGSCPKGSKGATQRLLRGKHPLAISGKAWPDGSTQSQPKRLR